MNEIVIKINGDAISRVSDHAKRVRRRNTAKNRPKISNHTPSVPRPFFTLPAELSPRGPTKSSEFVRSFIVSTDADNMCHKESLEVCLVSSWSVWYLALGSQKATSSPR